MAGDYNPASLRVRTVDGTVDLRGVVTLILPNGTVVELGQGAVLLKVTGAAGGGAVTPFVPTQDSVNPRLFTIPGADTWTASSIRVYWNGQYLNPVGSPPDFVVSGSGNRTITLDPTVPIPLTTFGVVTGEGIKV